jgi:curved DNA-binding protein CbpA
MDFYVILGVTRSASMPEVKRAYRRLARRYHPDINPGDRDAAERFKEILSAYETLSDPDRRRRYDQGGFERDIATGASVGFEGFDFSAAVHANQQSTFGDLFAEGNTRRAGRRMRAVPGDRRAAVRPRPHGLRAAVPAMRGQRRRTAAAVRVVPRHRRGGPDGDGHRAAAGGRGGRRAAPARGSRPCRRARRTGG